MVRFSPDGLLLAAACNNGSVQIYNARTSSLAYVLPASHADAMPITALRFRPADAAAAKTRNVLLTGGADGFVRHWHATSGKLLSTIEEAGNQVLAVDYREDAAFFVTAGKDL